MLFKLINKTYFKFFTNEVGVDNYGNIYYESKRLKHSNGQKRRYCFYNGILESSKVPAIWHGWLHYTTNKIPSHSLMVSQASWQPNTTIFKPFLPQGSRAREDFIKYKPYKPWRPN